MTKSVGLNIRQATSLTWIVCDVAGPRNMIADANKHLANVGVVQAIQNHSDAKIFDWLFDAISYQGVSDAAAASYIAEHGALRAKQVARMMRQQPSCQKLEDFWHFNRCGYRKLKSTCNNPDHFQHCPIPRHDLRNGSLNQAAYSLYLFMTNVARGDFVGWLDHLLERSLSGETNYKAESVIDAMCQVHGLSRKVLNMSLATLLMGGDPNRQNWIEAGAELIAIDSLIHNWLHRTGILRGADAEHSYGPGCYSEGNCADLVRRLSSRIDTREFNCEYPRNFPRFVQLALWRFCAQQQLNQCNGNNVNDAHRCAQRDCILYSKCARLKLGRASHNDPTTTRSA